MTPVAEALRLILADAVPPRESESLPLRRAAGRVLSRDLAALRTQPPCDVSAMDGYAVRSEDVAVPPATLAVLGESAAGRGFPGAVTPGGAARIFTGAPVPPGADTVVIQENTEPGGAGTARVTVLQAEPAGRHIRRAGQDFREGQVLLSAGRRLGAADLALAAAMNHASLPVFRRPRVAVLATGDELVTPGEVPGPGQIVASNSFASWRWRRTPAPRCSTSASPGTTSAPSRRASRARGTAGPTCW